MDNPFKIHHVAARVSLKQTLRSNMHKKPTKRVKLLPVQRLQLFYIMCQSTGTPLGLGLLVKNNNNNNDRRFN